MPAHSKTIPPWKQRYYLPKVAWARIAKANASRAVILSDRNTDAPQVFTVDLDSGEIAQLTRRDTGVSLFSLAFSPAGDAIYYLDDEKGNELGHLVRLPYDMDDGVVGEDMTPDMSAYAIRGTGFSRDGKRLGLVAVSQGAYQLLSVDLESDGRISAPRQLYSDKLEFWQAELSADARYIGIISTRRARSRLYSVVVFDADSGEEVGELWDGDGTSVELTGFSPVQGDPRVLGVSTRSGSKRPFLWNPCTDERRDIYFPELSGDMLAWDWSDDGQTLLLCHSFQAQQQLYTYHLPAERLQRLEHPVGVYDLSVGPFGTFAQLLPNGNIFTLWQSAAHPMQLVELDGRTGRLLRTIAGPEETIAGRPWQSITFPSSDGTEVQGWLAVPEGAGPFPTIIHMHGGPHYMAPAGYSVNAQCWTDHGFAFLDLNFRGSTGFGSTFQSQIWGDLGHWELEDMVAARQWLVDNGIAQAGAVFLSGGSYGGYLTLWGLARRPELWAGGMAAIAIADWVATYEDANEAMKGAFSVWHAGTLEEVPERYVRSSPTTYAEAIQAPLVVIQGFNDTRTPQRQMQEFEAKMKSLGKSIEVRWFDAGHGGLGIEDAIQEQESLLQFALEVLAKTPQSV